MLSPVSILAVTVLSGLMAIAVLGSLLPAKIAGINYCVAANALAIVALALFAMRGHLSPLLSIVGANGLLAFSVLAVLEGCHRFLGRSKPSVAGYAGVALVVVGVAYWTYVSPDFNARVAVVSAFHAFVCASLAWAVFRGRPLRRSAYSYYFVAIAASLFCIGHITRGVIYGAGLLAQSDLMQATPVNIAFLSLGILALPSLSIGIVMLAHDRMAGMLERLANIDDLTGILGRRAFLARAQALLAAPGRANAPFALAIIDIDRFKAINDTHGHAAGDRVLTDFAAFMERNLRPGDVVGRLGGEEFGVLYPRTAAQEAVALLETLRGSHEAMQAKHLPVDMKYTFSVGIDEYRRGETLSVLMARVDAALYKAKAAGRNRVVVAQ